MKQLTDTMQIGGLEIRGRIVMPPMATYQCTEEGLVTDPVVDYYRKRAENPHVGLIITEHSYICPQGRAKVRQMSAAGDDCIPGMRRLTDAVHQGGARVFAQLNHGGSASPREVTGDAGGGPQRAGAAGDAGHGRSGACGGHLGADAGDRGGLCPGSRLDHAGRL